MSDHPVNGTGPVDEQKALAAPRGLVPRSEAKVPIDVLASWPDLCTWLAEQGLLIFTSAINPAEKWHWSWRGKILSGYPDAQAAILASLQEQFPAASCPPSPFFSSSEHLVHVQSTFKPEGEQPAKQQKRKGLFS